jgi:peptidoglycan/xylan/chitin deacetylase (PgdA/CDA1 family)/lauroyl/myristoyl acyltransferase
MNPHPRSLFALLCVLAIFFLFPLVWWGHFGFLWISLHLLVTGLLIYGNLRVTCGWFGPVVTGFRTGAKEIWLTIDDGPDPEHTPRTLELLKRFGVRATFFLIGEKVQAHPHLARAILDHGHTIGNHSASHPHAHFWAVPPWVAAREIDEGAAAIKAATGVNPAFFRAPVGMANYFVRSALRIRKLPLIAWSARGVDGVTAQVTTVVENIFRDVRSGGIVLLHEGSSVAAAPRNNLVALEAVLTRLQTEGYACAIPKQEQFCNSPTTLEAAANALGTLKNSRDAIGLHGDFWTRFLLRLLQFLPAWFCSMMAWPISLIFYACASGQRVALMANLRALRPEMGAFRRWWAGHRIFLQFARTYMDRLWILHLGHALKWEIHDREDLDRQLAKPEGLLLFTIHSGNYDIAAMLFAQQFPRSLHIVRAPEQTQGLHHLRAAELTKAQQDNSHLHIHYSADEWHLGLELARVLQAGAVVAVQGDRVLSSTNPVALENGGINFRLPRGPLILAEISGVPCYPIFLARLSRCRYRLHSGNCFYDGKNRRRAEDIGHSWLSAMKPFIAQHWDQWFVFENILTRSQNGTK